MLTAKAYQITNKELSASNLASCQALKLIKNSKLDQSTFESSQMPRISILGSDLSRTNFRKCNLRHSKMSYSNFDRSNLEWADMSSNTFFRINFNRANLQCSSFEGAEVSECRLTKADFSWSNLKDALFSKTDLQGANFSHCDLEGARFDHCKLKGAIFNMNTRLPFSIDVAKSLGMRMVPLKIFETVQ